MCKGYRVNLVSSLAMLVRRTICAVSLLLVITVVTVFSQSSYEGKLIEGITIAFENLAIDPVDADKFKTIAGTAVGATYSTTKIRDSIAALYATNLIASVEVTATNQQNNQVSLRFSIKRKTRVEKVSVKVGNTVGDKISEEDLLFKLNILESGVAITEQTLRTSADTILTYLRDRGFYRSEVNYTQTPLTSGNTTAVVFEVKPNEQAKVETFAISIEGLKEPISSERFELKAGEFYSRDRLTKDLATIKSELRKKDFVSPFLEEPRIVYDNEKNTISITQTGRVGPLVRVTVDAEKEKVGEGTQNTLLPVKREGTLDYAAIIEGERRLETYFQEKGYFFANVTPICSIDPPLDASQGQAAPNETEFLCSLLGGSDLVGKTVSIKYSASLNRKLRLVKMSIRGTKALGIEDVAAIPETQKANFLGIIPLFGYGRGYTSLETLDADAVTIASIMAELGYRESQVRVNQGVAPNGEDLIITFEVDEGPRTFVRNVTVSGNKSVPESVLRSKVQSLKSTAYSRARFRNAVRSLSDYYSEQGYFDARVSFTSTDVPGKPEDERREIDLAFKVENENTKVIVDRILITGQTDVKTAAILKTSPLKRGTFLRAKDIYATEQNLYATDAFKKVTVVRRDAGVTANGDRSADVLIGIEEQPPRLITYGGGYSTDLGASGFFDIRHINLLGNLWQGGARVRVSQRQQLIQFDFVNPRFLRDGEGRFAPLTISAQYQRDATITRFFRSTFDKGTFGIVQRIDANGNPIDEFGIPAGSPTLNRLTLSAETSRTISRKDRSIVFARYRFEDVRLVNIDSLLIKELLTPDSRVRISGFGVTYVRDTRENCSREFSLLELIEKGEIGDPCRYNAGDPTRGSFLTADYNVSLPQLGANIGFHKFQASYNFYYTLNGFRKTTFAARAILGLANVFSAGNRFPNANLSDLNGILPISERFYAGGSTTIRGFDFEEAGPRVVVVPQGTFRNSAGENISLDPFTIPFGGNALAVVNLEARIPLTKSIRAVPFYDGGNVFRRVGDIFKSPDVPANDVLRQNLRALWTHTVGLGLRLKTPIGGEFAVDYGFLLNPPRFLIPQIQGPNAIYQLQKSQLHFRFSQAF